MISLFGSLGVGASSLQVDQEGVAVAGQNLANANNAGYSRQVLEVQTCTPVEGSDGSEGTGVEVASIQQVRSSILDQQIQGQISITSLLQSQQTALQDAEAGLGEQLQTTSSSSGTSGVGSTGALADSLQGLFNAFQTLSTSPSNVSDRQTVVSQAEQLAQGFNQANQGLTALTAQLNQSINSNLSNANQLLTSIAGLNQQIAVAQGETGGTANDLIDTRQKDIESLAGLVNCQTAPDGNGMVNVSVGGQLLVSGSQVQDTLQTYDAGGGQMLVQTVTGATPVTLSGGSVQGTIEARDGGIASLQTGLNNLASQLISQVNSIYSKGYDLHGNTGSSFFAGTDASSIAVNSALVADPTTLQAAGVAGEPGDNQVALALAQLGEAPQSALDNQTFSQSYATTATNLGSAIQSAGDQLTDQQTIQTSLTQQRTSVSGVSMDEEMTNLLKYQQAYEASAHLVSTINQMLSDLNNMKTS